jgi:hypothetical protein
MAIENGNFIVDLHTKSGDFQYFLICIQEGNPHNNLQEGAPQL